MTQHSQSLVARKRLAVGQLEPAPTPTSDEGLWNYASKGMKITNGPPMVCTRWPALHTNPDCGSHMLTYAADVAIHDQLRSTTSFA